MENSELYHYGVKGMKWGVHRTPEQLAKAGTSKKKSALPGIDFLRQKTKSSAKPKPKKVEPAPEPARKKKVGDMTDEELRTVISRLELEKKYKDLYKELNPVKTNKGKAFVKDVLEKSGKNIATQAATYAMGVAINKTLGKDIVNPKKGQKDK